MVIIHLNRRSGEKFQTKISLIDFDKVNELKGTWFTIYSTFTKSYYAIMTIYLGKNEDGTGFKNKELRLHRFIMDAKEDEIVDHKFHDTLDNRRENLRITNDYNNNKNRNGKNKNNKSGYRNVFWSTGDNRWLVMLQVNGKQTCFGRFKLKDVDLAGICAEEARKEIYGEFAGIS